MAPRGRGNSWGQFCCASRALRVSLCNGGGFCECTRGTVCASPPQGSGELCATDTCFEQSEVTCFLMYYVAKVVMGAPMALVCVDSQRGRSPGAPRLALVTCAPPHPPWLSFCSYLRHVLRSATFGTRNVDSSTQRTVHRVRCAWVSTCFF